jgi:presequence protease
MWNTIYEHIFPNNNYRFNSNGNTEGIVKLTHQEMIEFYKSWYHPSNGQAFCYGPDDFVSDCLAEIDAAVDQLEANPEIREKSKVAWQPFKSIMATKARVPYPNDDTDDYRLALAYILNDAPMDSKTEVAWILLEELLMCPTSGIMAKMVVDLNLGDDITGGLDLSLQQATFVIGVTGIKTEAEIATVEKAINDKLQSIVEQGFDQAMVIAAANKLDYRVSPFVSARKEPCAALYFMFTTSTLLDMPLTFWLFLSQPTNSTMSVP